MTKMRDNFSNPNPFLSQVKNYQELVNQPHWAEPLADSFKQSSNQPANGPKQRMANAMMGGFASGIQGAVNKERQDRLSPILEQAGQITAQAAKIEAQMQQDQQRVITGTNFVRDNITRIMALGEGSMAQDSIGTQGVARELGREYQKAFGLNLGEFDHYDSNSRRIYYAKDGAVIGYSIPDTLREYATHAFGEQAPYVMRTLDPYSKNIWENTQALQQAELDQKRSTANVNNAHAGVFNKQAQEIQHKMDNPQMSPEQYKANAKLAEFNRNLIKDEIKPKIEANERMLGSLEALDQIAIESPGIVGSDELTKMMRSVGEIFGLDPNIDYAKLKSVEFEKMLKPILGAQLGEKEGERVLSKFPSIGMSKVALRKFISEEIPKIKEEIVKGNQLVNAYNREYHTNLYNPDIHQNLEGDIERYTNERMTKKNKNTNNNDLSDLE